MAPYTIDLITNVWDISRDCSKSKETLMRGSSLRKIETEVDNLMIKKLFNVLSSHFTECRERYAASQHKCRLELKIVPRSAGSQEMCISLGFKRDPISRRPAVPFFIIYFSHAQNIFLIVIKVIPNLTAKPVNEKELVDMIRKFNPDNTT